MQPKTLDYILVGQGLAGSCVSIQLLTQGKTFLMIDRPHENSATFVAAGLFNPITGKNLTKTWLADELFAYLQKFYTQAEQLTGRKFFNPMSLYRPFVSIEEQNAWMGRSADKEIANYIEHVRVSRYEPHLVKNEFGGLLLKQCGYLNTTIFCKAVRQLIQHEAKVLDEDFIEGELIIEPNAVVYKGYRAKKIILCQGEKANETKLFSWLPIKPLKGQTLSIQTPEVVNTIFNRGVYVVPEIWKVGATYEFHDQSRMCTQKGYDELISKLDELIAFPYQVNGQSWGMRPTTSDRRPILGAHPQFNSVVIFNGLGTKGVSLAPFFSYELLNWLENNVAVNKEVDIQRYKHYYYAGNLSR